MMMMEKIPTDFIVTLFALRLRGWIKIIRDNIPENIINRVSNDESEDESELREKRLLSQSTSTENSKLTDMCVWAQRMGSSFALRKRVSFSCSVYQQHFNDDDRFSHTTSFALSSYGTAPSGSSF